jgi:succinate dehydrogenase (ubiquinone) flavoprotein subunit
MAAGEAACASVHGANRLGANSLLDIVVFGRAVANRTKQILKPGTPLPQIPASVGEESIANIDRMLHANGSLKTAEIRLDMQKVMQQYAAVFRTKETLDTGVTKIEEVSKKMADIQVTDRSLVWNTDLIESLELQNL